MQQATTSIIDTLLKERRVKWEQLSLSQKREVVAAANDAVHALGEIGRKARSRGHRSVESVYDHQKKKVYVVDTDTGEIVPPKHPIADIPEFRTRLPSQARDQDELIEACAMLRMGRNTDPLQESSRLLDLVRDRHLQQAEFDLLLWLIQNIQGQNFCLTTTEVLRQELDLKSDLLSRRLRKLRESGLIRVINEDMHKKGDRLFEIHPAYGYRGGESLEDHMVRRWYSSTVPD